jgi:hypothetical protein
MSNSLGGGSGQSVYLLNYTAHSSTAANEMNLKWDASGDQHVFGNMSQWDGNFTQNVWSGNFQGDLMVGSGVWYHVVNGIVQDGGVPYKASTFPIPACAVGHLNATATVADATTPTYLGTYVSGGTKTTKVLCQFNGSTYAWVTY